MPAVAGLLLTIALGMFLAVQLFRWEKDEKIQPRKKVWVLAVLGPFLILGCYRSYSKEHLGQNEAMFRDLQRSGVFLIRNTRVFVGDGTVMENATVLVRDGKIAEIYPGAGPDADSIRADVVEGAGKTLLPGLIDVHVHLAPTGGISYAAEDNDPAKTMAHAAAALLYSGVTAARSVGDGLERLAQAARRDRRRQQAGRAALRLRPHVHHRRRARHRVSAERFPRHCARPCRTNWCARPRRPRKRAAR